MSIVKRLPCLVALILLAGFFGPLVPAPAQTSTEKAPEFPTEMDGKKLDQWIALLQNPKAAPSSRQEAARVVLAFGPAAHKAVPALLVALKDNDVGLRATAITSVSRLVKVDKGFDPLDLPVVVKSVSALLNAKELQRSTRLLALMTLADIGPKAQPGLTSIYEVASDPYSWEIRQAVCYAIGRIAPDPVQPPDEKAVPILLARLAFTKDGYVAEDCPPVRVEAVMALSSFLGMKLRNTEIDNAKKALQKSQKDPDHRVAIWSRTLLLTMDESLATPKELAPYTQYLLNDPDPKVRIETAQALRRLGPKARSRIPDMIESMRRDINLAVILAVIECLGMMGETASPAVPDLILKLDDSELAVRVQAAVALGTLGVVARSAVSRLTQCLGDKQETFVFAAVAALAHIGAPAAEALPALENVGKTHKNETVRQAAKSTIVYIREQMNKKKP